MLQDERRELHERYVRAAMATQNRDQRIITFSWPHGDAAGRSSHDAVVDGRTQGVIDLAVRSASLDENQADMLRRVGFRKGFDDDHPGATVYSRPVHQATVADVLTFIDWVFLFVCGAPDDYDAGIRTASGKDKGEQSGCLKSCRQMVQFILIILFVGGAIAALLW